MREIKLNDTLQEVSICGQKYTIDINDFDCVNALTAFKEKHISVDALSISDELMEDCEHVINTVLGTGVYDKLFSGKKTMKAYLLVNELAKIYLDLFMKEEREEREAKVKEEMEQILNVANSLDKFQKTMKYAENKYGTKQHVSGKPSKKYKNRRH
nr:MAG TPA: hypothetical protein [Caudoviricetes sp.]